MVHEFVEKSTASIERVMRDTVMLNKAQFAKYKMDSEGMLNDEAGMEFDVIFDEGHQETASEGEHIISVKLPRNVRREEVRSEKKGNITKESSEGQQAAPFGASTRSQALVDVQSCVSTKKRVRTRSPSADDSSDGAKRTVNRSLKADKQPEKPDAKVSTPTKKYQAVAFLARLDDIMKHCDVILKPFMGKTSSLARLETLSAKYKGHARRPAEVGETVAKIRSIISDV